MQLRIKKYFSLLKYSSQTTIAYMKTIHTYKPVKQHIYTAEEFIRIADLKRDNIESSQFIPPKVGEDSFGSFKVVFRYAELMEASV